MKNPKQYDIKTLEQILNVVTDENIEVLISDFAQWLIFCNETIKKVREDNPEVSELKNFEILQCSFLWTDDGIKELTGVITKDIVSGEVRRTDFKPESNQR